MGSNLGLHTPPLRLPSLKKPAWRFMVLINQLQLYLKPLKGLRSIYSYSGLISTMNLQVSVESARAPDYLELLGGEGSSLVTT